MIVEGTKTKVIDIEVDPLHCVVEMYTMWKAQCGLSDYDTLKDSGYWLDHNGKQLRLATIVEIEQHKAFKIVSEVAKNLN